MTGIEPSDADAGSILWNSSEGGVISWAVNGGKVMITGIGMGLTEFRGTGTGGADETCLVRVRDVNVKLDYDKLSLLGGETGSFTLQQSPVVFDDIKWSIDDSSIATISASGNKCEVTAGNKQGTTTVRVAVGPYNLQGQVSVIGDDYEPCVLMPCYEYNLIKIDEQDSERWPWKFVQNHVVHDGETIFLAPCMAISPVSGYMANPLYCAPCFEGGTRIPAEKAAELTIEFNDPDGVSAKNYIHSDNSFFSINVWNYNPTKTGSVTITTPAGKSCTVYYVSAIKKFALTKIDRSGTSVRRDLVASTDTGGTITVNRSSLDTSEDARYAVDFTGMECLGYAVTKDGELTSSNTNVAALISGSGYAYLNFNGCSTGTTKLIIGYKGVEYASITLVVR